MHRMTRGFKHFFRQFRFWMFRYIGNIQFKFSHISFWGKGALVSIVICIIATFLPWFKTHGSLFEMSGINISSVSSYSSLLGFVGFFQLACLIFATFYIVSLRKKQKIHHMTRVYLSPYFICLATSGYILYTSIHSFLLLYGLQIFSSQMMLGQGIPLMVTGGLVLGICGILMKAEEKKSESGSYMYENIQEKKEKENTRSKENMSLPI